MASIEACRVRSVPAARTILTLALTFAALTTVAHAGPIAVTNPSFELQDVPDANFVPDGTLAGNLALYGWSDSYVGVDTIIDPSNPNFSGTTGDNANTLAVLPNGGQVGVVISTFLSQTLSTSVVPGGNYSLTFAIGAFADQPWGTYTVSLLTTNSDTIITSNTPLAPPLGSFQSTTLMGTAPPTASGNLVIRFQGLELGKWTGIDAVSLSIEDAPAVPEPSTYALGLIGLAGLGLVAWRKRK